MNLYNIFGITIIYLILLPQVSTATTGTLGIHDNFFSDYEERLIDFNREISASLELRKNAMAFFRKETNEGSKQFFDATDISQIHSTIDTYIKNRNVLLNDIAFHYREVIRDAELILTDDVPTRLISTSASVSLKNKKILYINPTDKKGQQYILIIKMVLAAALTLYDNFIIAIMPYQDNGHFRRSINYDNLDNKYLLEEISGNFHRLDNYKDTLRIVEFNDQLKQWSKLHPESAISNDKDAAYFDVLINGSYTNKRIRSVTFLENVSFRTQRIRRVLRDFLIDSGNKTMNFVSGIFGNSMGLIATRKGHLKNLSSVQKTTILNSLEPGDILLEKTPFRLTDRFIPGHWGHVAIWVGNEKQLREIGVWDKLPILYKKAQRRFKYRGPSFQSQVRNGMMIVEALRSGVQMSSLGHFLNVDDLAILRSKTVTKETLKRYVLKTFEQIGKEYDFNFDVETDTRIVCSELAFVAYADHKWPIKKTVGRYTISPDHIGSRAINNGPFEIVLLYHNGKMIMKNLNQVFYQLLRGKKLAKRDHIASNPVF